MLKKNKIFIFFSFFLFGTFIYIIFGIFAFLDFNKNKKNLFKTYEDLNFHMKYSEKLHHLRDSNRWGEEKNDYLFSTISKNKKGKLVLLQGDSWMEQVQEIDESLKLFQDFSKKNDINIINGGITSYAPTLMSLQYKFLKTDFDINPSIVVIYVDQTDIGDEICRYDPSKKYKEKKVIEVKNESFTNKIYDYTKIYQYSNIDLNSDYPLKFFRLSNFQLKYFLIRNYNRLGEILDVGWKNRGTVKCRFKEIQKYLFNLDKKSKSLFSESIINYLNILEKDQNIRDVLLVSFPHKKHLTKEYKINVSNLIENIIQNRSYIKVTHLNFSKYIYSYKDAEKIYLQGDPSSHLNETYHSELFVKKILEKLKVLLERS